MPPTPSPTTPREDELDGVPQDVVQAARAAAEAEGKDGYKLTLKMPSYLPVMQFAHSSALRERLYRAYVTRASDQGDPKFDNTRADPRDPGAAPGRGAAAGLSQLRRGVGRAQDGRIARSRSSASCATSARRARPYAREGRRRHARLRRGASWASPTRRPGTGRYIGEKLKEARYSFSEQEVKQYFTAPKVLAGLFKIVETLFEVTIRRDCAPVWNPAWSSIASSAKGARRPSTELVGQFYLDPSARTGKRGGAWMDDVRARWLRPDNGQLQTPVAHLVCNFAEGVDGKPPLLTHDDVITLFHEFGHGLHHMLTRVNERDVSGISGVEWDAVELPSQFMENFCWEWDVLRHMTAHVDTGAPLPRELFDKMLAAKNFQSGLATLRQIEFALFDMLLHTEHDPAAGLHAAAAPRCARRSR